MVKESANPGAPQRTKSTADTIKMNAHKELLKTPHQRILLATMLLVRPDLNVMIEVQNTTREKVILKP